MRKTSRRPKSSAASPPSSHAAAETSQFWVSPKLVLAAWLVVFVGYLAVFYATPLTNSGAQPLRRVMFLLMAFTPEFFLSTWTGNGMPVAVFDRLPVLLVASFILVWAGVIGWAALSTLDLTRRLSWCEQLVFAEGMGLNLLSLATLAAGLAGWLSRPFAWMAPLAIASGAWFAWAIWRRRHNPPAFVEASQGKAEPHREVWWFAAGAPALFVIIWGAMMPPWEFDVREYHLQAPKEWFLQGRIDFLPHNVYANMPLASEMHAVFAMGLMPGERNWWWGALVGKTVMAFAAPLTALGLFAAGRRFFSQQAGVVAALVYLTVPWIAHAALAGLNDHVVAFYTFLGFYGLLLWRNDRGWPLLALAGFFAGGAAGCKYPGLVFAAVPLAVIALGIEWRRERQSAAVATEATSADSQPSGETRTFRRGPVVSLLRVGMIFTIAALLGGGLWYGKNWVLAGNPFYPLLYNVFGGKSWTPEQNEQWTRAHQVPQSAEQGPYAPHRLMRAISQVTWRGEWLSPLVMPLLLLAALQARNRRVLALAAGLALFIYAAWWLLTHRIDRFWLPALPLLALLAGAGAAWSDNVVWRRGVLAAVLFGVLANTLVIASPWVSDNRIFVALEALRTDIDDPEHDRLGRVNAAHAVLNRVVPPGGVALLVGDAQPFDLEMPALYNTCFDDCVLETLMTGRNPQERRQALHSRGVTHVFVHWGEIYRYREPGNYGYSDYPQPAVFQELVQQGVLRPIWPEDASPPLTLKGNPMPQVFEVDPP
jgi:hypothetical protein